LLRIPKKHGVQRTLVTLLPATILLLLVFVQISYAYTPITRVFGVREGFSAHIYNVVQDPNGIVWMAQDGGGLIAFDGKQVNRYDTRSGLPSNSVNQVMLSRDYDIWVSLSDGPPIWKSYNEHGDWNKTKAGDFIGSNHIMETLNDQILIATSKGIFVLSGDSWKLWEPAQNKLVTDTNFNYLFQASSGTIYGLSGAGRIWKLFPNQPALLMDQSAKAKLNMQIFETHDRRILVVGHRDGLMELMLNGELKKAEPEASQLPEGVLPCYVYNTRNERLVIGTWGNGVYIFNNGKLEQIVDKRYGLPYEYVESLFEDREGNLYVTAMTGGLYQIINLSHSKFKNITKADGLLGDVVWNIDRNSEGELRVLSHGNLLTEFKHDGSIGKLDLQTLGIEGIMVGIYSETPELTWVYGNGGAHLLDNNNNVIDKLTADNFPSRNIRGLDRDEAGNLYIFTSSRGLVIKDKSGKLSIYDEKVGMGNTISAMAIDKNGRYVMATEEGINIFDPKTKDITAIKSYEGMSLKRLSDVAIDTVGRMWFASPRGVFMMKDGVIRLFTVADGLPNDNIYLTVADKLGSVWVGTSDGVARINKNNKVLSFGYNDGMLNPETNSNSGFLDEDGTVWFGTPSGIAGINSSNIPLNLQQPNIIITDMEVLGEPHGVLENHIGSENDVNIKFPSNHNSLTITYTSPHMSWPSSISFVTRLIGVSENWSKPSRFRQINLANLAPDQYRFEVKACNRDGICSSKPASISFTIVPPFYQTYWFRTLIAFCIIMFILLTYKLRMDSHIARAKELERIVEERTREIREMSLRDPLTNLRNRRYVFEAMPHYVPKQMAVDNEKRAQNSNVIGFFMVDIDHFKNINDQYGHDSGDMVLTKFARLLQSSFRPQDIVCRWGGEEFLVVTSQSSVEQIKMLAERIRHTVAISEFKITGTRAIKLTCSIGVTSLPFHGKPTALDLKWEDAISIADMGLYRAKEDGRNQWVAVLPGERIPHSYEKKIFLTNLDWSVTHNFMQLESE